MTGLVVKNTGSCYIVRTDEGHLIQCKLKGTFRLKGIRTTNPVAIGDRVIIDDAQLPTPNSQLLTPNSSLLTPNSSLPTPNSQLLTPNSSLLTPNSSLLTPNFHYITSIADRRNYIIRKSQNLSKQSHILAANVDQALLIVTVSRPETSTTFIDRFLASAEAYRVPVVLVFNKTDILTADELHLQQMMVTLYETIGYECRQISAANGTGVEELRPLLQGKTTLLSGNSGVGKSTLINRLVPGANLRTAEISDTWEKGMHTTTFSEMIPLDSQSSDIPHPSFLIDTPGIKGFGTFDMEREELTSYFKEIYRFSQQCRFSNCTHTHEPGCAVIRALEDHYIAQSRYQSYLSMLDDKEEGKYRKKE